LDQTLTIKPKDIIDSYDTILSTEKCSSPTTIMLGLQRRRFTRGYNTNDTLVQLHEALTPLSTQNLKEMDLWVFILI